MEINKLTMDIVVPPNNLAPNMVKEKTCLKDAFLSLSCVIVSVMLMLNYSKN